MGGANASYPRLHLYLHRWNGKLILDLVVCKQSLFQVTTRFSMGIQIKVGAQYLAMAMAMTGD